MVGRPSGFPRRTPRIGFLRLKRIDAQIVSRFESGRENLGAAQDSGHLGRTLARARLLALSVTPAPGGEGDVRAVVSVHFTSTSGAMQGAESGVLRLAADPQSSSGNLPACVSPKA